MTVYDQVSSDTSIPSISSGGDTSSISSLSTNNSSMAGGDEKVGGDTGIYGANALVSGMQASSQMDRNAVVAATLVSECIEKLNTICESMGVEGCQDGSGFGGGSAKGNNYSQKAGNPTLNPLVLAAMMNPVNTPPLHRRQARGQGQAMAQGQAMGPPQGGNMWDNPLMLLSLLKGKKKDKNGKKNKGMNAATAMLLAQGLGGQQGQAMGGPMGATDPLATLTISLIHLQEGLDCLGDAMHKDGIPKLYRLVSKMDGSSDPENKGFAPGEASGVGGAIVGTIAGLPSGKKFKNTINTPGNPAMTADVFCTQLAGALNIIRAHAEKNCTAETLTGGGRRGRKAACKNSKKKSSCGRRKKCSWAKSHTRKGSRKRVSGSCKKKSRRKSRRR